MYEFGIDIIKDLSESLSNRLKITWSRDKTKTGLCVYPAYFFKDEEEN